MNKDIFITIAFSVFFTSQSMAQPGEYGNTRRSDAQRSDAQRSDAQRGDAQRGDAQRNQLKGPAAKNYKLWKDAASTKTIMVKQPMEFKGPAAKNYKPWKEDCEMYPIVFEERRALKGPKAKNQQYTTRTKYLPDSVSAL